MTDRIKGFTVVLDKNYREDDVEYIKQAIEMIKGVSLVKEHKLGAEDLFIESRVKIEMVNKMYDFINENLKP